MHSRRAAGYPFDPGSRRFLVQVPCWLSTLELAALGHTLALTEDVPDGDGISALGSRCTKHSPQITDSMLDRGDWQEVLASAFRAQFAPEGLPAFLGDYGWSLDVSQARSALSSLDHRPAELHAALRRELELADLVRERLSGALPVAAPFPEVDWQASQPPAGELPIASVARQLAERMNCLAAGSDPGPEPEALAVLEGRARDEVTAMLEALKELATPLRSAEDLPAVLSTLRRLLTEADRLGSGVYLGFS